MKYTAKYFKDNMPEWKRKKMHLWCRNFIVLFLFMDLVLQQIMELVLIPYHTFP